jgi:DNA-binding MarR family transcriptional regulator
MGLERTIYRHPGFLARRLQQIAVGVFLEETAGFDLTPVQYGLMAVVRSEPGIDQVSAGDRIGLDRTTVADIARRIAAKRWIRVKVDARDRRVRRLYLTATGARLLRAVSPSVNRAQRRILEPLSHQARKDFCAYITQVLAHHNAATRVPLTDRNRTT